MTGLQTDHSPAGLSTKTMYAFVFYLMCATFPIPLTLLDFVILIMAMKLFIIQFSPAPCYCHPLKSKYIS